ncbi:carboxymuconolactone decarboxylase family protein [Bacillus alkalicellulosilyticus]|uniref:carboxymuconolactone decarboxylase family protein n=1 Tax=Alkalihalobacterium alkalicellulosilyticum TaxID=1912214 RepID=UPI000997DC32|nr:carboxymuconolactone decarboxylase family protein [Bacillus alkalicellulosilyticus]
MIALLPDLYELIEEFNEKTVEKDVLSQKDKALVQLTLVLAQENSEDIKNSVIFCKQSGLSNEEIGHACALVLGHRYEKMRNLLQTNTSRPVEKKSTQTSCCQ